MPHLPYEDLDAAVAIVDDKAEMVSQSQAQKASDFISKDKAPYGILSGMGIVVGSAGVILAEVKKDMPEELKKSIRGVGIVLIVGGAIFAFVEIVVNYKNNSIKRALSDSTSKMINNQTDSKTTLTDFYTAAGAQNADRVVGGLTGIGLGNAKIGMSSRLVQSSLQSSAAPAALNGDDVAGGIQNLNTIYNNNKNMVDGYIRD